MPPRRVLPGLSKLPEKQVTETEYLLGRADLAIADIVNNGGRLTEGQAALFQQMGEAAADQLRISANRDLPVGAGRIEVVMPGHRGGRTRAITNNLLATMIANHDQVYHTQGTVRGLAFLRDFNVFVRLDWVNDSDTTHLPLSLTEAARFVEEHIRGNYVRFPLASYFAPEIVLAIRQDAGRAVTEDPNLMVLGDSIDDGDGRLDIPELPPGDPVPIYPHSETAQVHRIFERRPHVVFLLTPGDGLEFVYIPEHTNTGVLQIYNEVPVRFSAVSWDSLDREIRSRLSTWPEGVRLYPVGDYREIIAARAQNVPAARNAADTPTPDMAAITARTRSQIYEMMNRFGVCTVRLDERGTTPASGLQANTTAIVELLDDAHDTLVSLIETWHSVEHNEEEDQGVEPAQVPPNASPLVYGRVRTSGNAVIQSTEAAFSLDLETRPAGSPTPSYDRTPTTPDQTSSFMRAWDRLRRRNRNAGVTEGGAPAVEIREMTGGPQLAEYRRLRDESLRTQTRMMIERLSVDPAILAGVTTTRISSRHPMSLVGIYREWKKGCSNTMVLPPWKCGPCTRAALRAMIRLPWIHTKILVSRAKDNWQKIPSITRMILACFAVPALLSVLLFLALVNYGPEVARFLVSLALFIG